MLVFNFFDLLSTAKQIQLKNPAFLSVDFVWMSHIASDYMKFWYTDFLILECHVNNSNIIDI